MKKNSMATRTPPDVMEKFQEARRAKMEEYFGADPVYQSSRFKLAHDAYVELTNSEQVIDAESGAIGYIATKEIMEKFDAAFAGE